MSHTCQRTRYTNGKEAKKSNWQLFVTSWECLFSFGAQTGGISVTSLNKTEVWVPFQTSKQSKKTRIVNVNIPSGFLSIGQYGGGGVSAKENKITTVIHAKFCRKFKIVLDKYSSIVCSVIVPL